MLDTERSGGEEIPAAAASPALGGVGGDLLCEGLRGSLVGRQRNKLRQDLRLVLAEDQSVRRYSEGALLRRAGTHVGEQVVGGRKQIGLCAEATRPEGAEPVCGR